MDVCLIFRHALSKVGKEEGTQEGGRKRERKREQEKEEEGGDKLNLWAFDDCYTCSQQKMERRMIKGRRKSKVKVRVNEEGGDKSG